MSSRITLSRVFACVGYNCMSLLLPGDQLMGARRKLIHVSQYQTSMPSCLDGNAVPMRHSLDGFNTLHSDDYSWGAFTRGLLGQLGAGHWSWFMDSNQSCSEDVLATTLFSFHCMKGL